MQRHISFCSYYGVLAAIYSDIGRRITLKIKAMNLERMLDILLHTVTITTACRIPCGLSSFGRELIAVALQDNATTRDLIAEA